MLKSNIKKIPIINKNNWTIYSTVIAVIWGNGYAVYQFKKDGAFNLGSPAK